MSHLDEAEARCAGTTVPRRSTGILPPLRRTTPIGRWPDWCAPCGWSATGTSRESGWLSWTATGRYTRHWPAVWWRSANRTGPGGSVRAELLLVEIRRHTNRGSGMTAGRVAALAERCPVPSVVEMWGWVFSTAQRRCCRRAIGRSRCSPTRPARPEFPPRERRRARRTRAGRRGEADRDLAAHRVTGQQPRGEGVDIPCHAMADAGTGQRPATGRPPVAERPPHSTNSHARTCPATCCVPTRRRFPRAVTTRNPTRSRASGSTSRS